MKITKNIEQLAREFADNDDKTFDRDSVYRGFYNGAKTILEEMEKIAFGKESRKIIRMQNLITDLMDD